MVTLTKNLLRYRELIWVLAWKNIVVRYKQAYLGLAWAILRPLMLVLVFCIVRAFVGIDTGGVPYPLLAFAALLPWMLFQDATGEGVSSIVNNAHLIRKIYFPREVFPLTAVLTKLIEFGISACVLALLMAYYGVPPNTHLVWVPLIVGYVVLVALAISFAGAAFNVHFRDIGAALPVALSLLMYASPVMYPLSLVKKKLLDDQIAGGWSSTVYTVYLANPLAGIIDAFQAVLLRAEAPDVTTVLPGMVVTVIALPISYLFFKNAERSFADVV